MGGFFGGGGSSNQAQQAPLTQFNVQSSGYGIPVPLLYGRNRIAANLIWYGDFTSIAHTTSYSAGKGGGGGGSSTSYTYTVNLMFGLCEGAVKSINAFWKDRNASAAMTPFTTFLGTTTQTAWSTLTSLHSAQALNYRGHAYVAALNYDLGTSANTGNHSFDVTGLLNYSGTIDNAEPSAVITDFLTNTEHGAGFSSSWLSSFTQFSNYCIANNLFIAPAFEAQQEARQHITDLFNILNSGIFFSEGKLKIVPFSDTTATANTVTYTPNVTPVFPLTDDDFMDDQQPVKVSRTATADAFNAVQVEYLDSAQSYNKAVVEAKDQASIEVYGLKPMSVVVAHMITDTNAARMIAQLILQRVIYTRNMYEFKVSWKYCQLEPCDYVTITDTRLGLNSVPVRVLAVEEDASGLLTITAEDAPNGISHAAVYTPQPGSGYTIDYNTPVSNVQAPVFFETPPNQSLSGLKVGIAITGQSTDTKWGGCEVYASNDGTNYTYIGRTTKGARYGALTTGAITSAVNQTPRVLLSGLGGQMLTASSTDASNDSTSCVIFNATTPSTIEYVDYTTATFNATNDYTLTLPIRGAHNTTAQPHAIGDTFIRVDNAIAYSNDMDLSMIGKTMYFKFLSFNIYGGAKQTLASVPAYTYTILGNMATLAPPAVSSFAAVQKVAGIQLSWTNPTGNTDFDHVEIWRDTVNGTGGALSGTATQVASVMNGVPVYLDPMPLSGTTYYYWIRSINKSGYPSAFSTSVTASTGSIGGTEIWSGVALPTTGLSAGRVIYWTSDAKLYRYNGAAWTKAVDGADILANSIAATSLNVVNLSAISASLGSISSGNITLDATSSIKGGQTAYNTGAGFYLGYSGANYVFSIGNPSGQYLRWTGTAMETNGLSAIGGIMTYTSAGGSGTLGSAIAAMSYTMTIPIGVHTIYVAEAIGGGGAGSAAGEISPNPYHGGGGGSGGVVRWTPITGFSGSGAETITVTIGAGGLGNATLASSMTAQAGTASTVTNAAGTVVVSAQGGGGGVGGWASVVDVAGAPGDVKTATYAAGVHTGGYNIMYYGNLAQAAPTTLGTGFAGTDADLLAYGVGGNSAQWLTTSGANGAYRGGNGSHGRVVIVW